MKIEELKALEARATKGPLKAEPRTNDSIPRLLGPDGEQEFGLLATFYWGCHLNTPEAEAKMVDELESLVELLAALRNAAPALLAVVDAAKALREHVMNDSVTDEEASEYWSDLISHLDGLEAL